MTDEPEVIRTSLRIPKALYEKLQGASAGKTMHAEIIHRLEASFETAAVDGPEPSEHFLKGFMTGVIDGILKDPTVLENYRKGHEERLKTWGKRLGKLDDGDDPKPSD